MFRRSCRAWRALSTEPDPAATTRVHRVAGKADVEGEVPVKFGSGTLRPNDLWFRLSPHRALEPVMESYYMGHPRPKTCLDKRGRQEVDPVMAGL